MKAIASTLFLLLSMARAHYRFSKLVIDGKEEQAEWTSVRTTKNYQDANPSPFYNISSTDMRCNQLPGHNNLGYATVKAGTVIGMVSFPDPIFHHGPLQFYMARVPTGSDLTRWEPEGNVWFKVGYLGHSFDSYGVVWPTYRPVEQRVVNATIPKELPSGDYLLRVEQIGFQMSAGIPDAQWYVACAQLRVTNGGNGTPGPLVSFPGVYTKGQDGLSETVYPIMTVYHPPGPPVWPSGVTGYDGTASP